jgi:Rap1a immunity proteins
MRLALIAFLLIATGWFTGTAQADPLTVGQLAARCGKLDLSEANQIKLRSASIGDALDGGKCWGHLEAYTDVASLALPNSPHPLGVCPPYKNNITFSEMAQMFLLYAKQNPDEIRQPAAVAVAKILAEKFPCPK